MKKTILTSLFIGLATLTSPFIANAQQNVVPEKPINIGGVGPAMSESVKMIPIEGIRFIVENYPDEGIVSMDKEFATNTYDVKLTNGTEIEFNSKGNVVEIDAEGYNAIPAEVIKAMVPSTTYQAMQKDGIVSNIESIEKNNSGYKIETNLPQDLEYFYTFEEIITPA